MRERGGDEEKKVFNPGPEFEKGNITTKTIP
jgi:hypothetical protein